MTNERPSGWGQNIRNFFALSKKEVDLLVSDWYAIQEANAKHKEYAVWAREEVRRQILNDEQLYNRLHRLLSRPDYEKIDYLRALKNYCFQDLKLKDYLEPYDFLKERLNYDFKSRTEWLAYYEGKDPVPGPKVKQDAD